MKRTIAMVLVLLMAFALVPVIGMQGAQAAATGIAITQQPQRFYLLNDTLQLGNIAVVYREYSGDTLVSETPVTGAVTYHLNDANRTVTQGSALNKAGEFTLTVHYKHTATNKNYQATTTIRVRAQKTTALTLLHGLNRDTYFVGEKLSLDGLSYGLSKISSGGVSTTPRIELTDPNLKISVDGVELAASDFDAVTLTAPTTAKAKINATYTDSDQFGVQYTNAGAEYEVLASPASVDIVDSTGTTVDPVVSYDTTKIGTELTWKASVLLTAGGTAVTDKPEYVSWGSSNENVATISSSGLLKIVGIGETTITIRSRGDNQKTATRTLKVVKAGPPLTDVRLNKSELTMTIGATDKLIATLVPEGAVYDETTAKAPAWSITSTPAGVVEIEKDSSHPFAVSVKAKKEGTATITFKASSTGTGATDYTASCVVTVNDIDVSQVYISPTTLTLLEGGSYPLQGTALPAEATDKTLTWMSSDESLATVTDGMVSVGKIDWATITKSDGSKWSASDIAAGRCSATVRISCIAASNPEVPAAVCVVTIKQGTLVTQLSLNKYSVLLNVGGSSQLNATIVPSNATTKTVSWKSSDPTIATVSSTGRLLGIKPGTCTITATSLGSGKTPLTRQCSVTVSAVLSGSMGLSALDLKLFPGQTATLTATLIPSNTTNKEVTFVSSKPTVATVDASNGLVTAVNIGTTTISVTANDGSGAAATCRVTVVDQVAVKKITLNMKDLQLLVNDTTTIQATVEPDYASETEVTWSSSNPNVAGVDENGKVSGYIAGQSAVITATAKDGTGISASVDVSVVNTFYGTGKVVNCLRRVNVRAQPSGQAKFKGYAYLNETFKVIGKTGNWYKIRYKNETCYIWTAYIRLVGDGTAEYASSGKATAPAPSTGTGTGAGTGTSTPTKCTVTNVIYAVNVRSGPGTNYNKVGIAALNTSYTYIGTYGDWYKLKFNATTEAYIHSNYIILS